MSLDKMSAEKTLTKPARKDTTTWGGQLAQLAAVVLVVFVAKGAIGELTDDLIQLHMAV